MKHQIVQETHIQAKLAGTAVGGAGISLADINEWIGLIAGIMAIIASGIAIYRFLKDRKDK